jgi:hypothetical protein
MNELFEKMGGATDFVTRLDTLQVEQSALNAKLAGLREQMSDYVQVSRYEHDLAAIEIDRDLVMVKAGYLNVALSESSPEEKQEIFASLKEKEQMLRENRPQTMMNVPGAGGIPDSGEVMATGTSDEFIIQLDRSDGQPLGCTVDSAEGQYLAVKTIDRGGLLSKWNDRNFEYAVKPGYFITEVNEKTGDLSVLQDELRKRMILKVKIHRTLESAPSSVTI